MTISPIFLLSLPRSGSTLLQRLVATHPAVATASEPWFLLPLFLAFRQSHVYAAYRQPVLVRAFEDLLATLPDGRAAHYEAVRRFAAVLYEQAAQPGATHFLDKTPRYHLIADELLTCFDDAGCILLWRNPLALAASFIETWGRGRWNLHAYRIDLYHGLSGLIEAHRRHGERIATLRYEDLVLEPEARLAGVMEHLGLDPVEGAAERFMDVRLEGRMGDPFERPGQDRIGCQGLDRWITTLANPIRRAWARRYLAWIGTGRLADMGYDHDELLARLAGGRPTLRRSFSDLACILYGRRAVTREQALMRRKRLLACEPGLVDVLSE